MIVIRNYEENDRSTIMAFIEHFQEYERAIEGDRKPGSEIAESYLDYLLQNCRSNDGYLVIVEENDLPVGYACYWTDSNYLVNKCLNITKQVNFSDMYIIATHRGKGIGTMLINRVEEYGRVKGAPRILFNVLANNHNARKLYLKNGCRDYAVLMVKEIQPCPSGATSV